MKVLVIGESCWDEFVYCKCTRLSPEAPVPVMVMVEARFTEGMAANVKQNLNAMLVKDVQLVTNTETIRKTRYVEIKTNHMVMRLDEGEQVAPIHDLYSIDFDHFDAICVSDYDKGFLTTDDLFAISKLHTLTFLDTKKPLGAWALRFTYIKVNESEWENSLKNGAQGMDWKDKLIVTLGEKGCRYNNEVYPTRVVKVHDLSGAGDTFLAGLVFKYLQTKNIIEAIEYANFAGASVVEKRGVSTI